ncbi:hypothetical protein L218DRAFT_866279 [Marasmius fiardii PR-910]|nr:hypothetical protein L218DRAFT_866279 [Marasmius fiardii PR-910]
MAPFHDALKVTFLRETDELHVYSGITDGEWSVGAVPNGGYVLGLIVEACIQRQSGTRHRDPIHVTAHFLRATAIQPFTIHVRKLREGKGFTNLVAELIQNALLTHHIFGVLTPAPESSDSVLTITPSSRYARRLPLYHHPSNAAPVSLREVYQFAPRLKATRGPEISAKNALDGFNRTNETSIGGYGLEWGQWLTFTNKQDILTPPSIAFMADMFRSPPSLLPKSERTGLPEVAWFPTLTMTLEFKFPVPSYSSRRTVGLYTNCRFVNDPQGRHDVYIEVWSAPCNVGEGEIDNGWREKQVCLAVSTQTALIVPMRTNTAKTKGGDKASKL